MFNNKGQSLVLFVLMIPILLGIMALVIDVGNAFNQKNNLDNTILFIIEYGLKLEQGNVESVSEENQNLEIGVDERISTTNQVEERQADSSDLNQVENKSSDNLELPIEDSLEVLLGYNLADHYELKIENGKIIISSKTYVNGIFSNILNIKGFSIESEYHGYLKDGEKIIKKIK